MPTLEEYLGGLFGSLSQARIMADVQTVDTAEKYAKHELLRHFAVPRLRFSDIELTIPIALDAIAPGDSGKAQITPQNKFELRKALLEQLPQAIGPRAPRLNANALGTMIDKRLEALPDILGDKPLETILDVFSKEVVEDMAQAATVGRLRLPTDAEFDRTGIDKIVRSAAAAAIKPILPKEVLGQLNVIAESHKLREQRPSDIIMIKMKVIEDGLEWQQDDHGDGQVTRKLVPE